jgi:hypothetical protein
MCEKTGYSSHREAATQMHFIQRKAKKKRPARVYYCEVCGQFHLTKAKHKHQEHGTDN